MAPEPHLAVATDGLSPEMTICESATEALVNIVKMQNQSEQSCPIREHGRKPKSLVGQMTWDSKMRPLKTKSQGPRTDQQNRVSKITRDAGGACPNHKRQKKFVRGVISVTVYVLLIILIVSLLRSRGRARKAKKPQRSSLEATAGRSRQCYPTQQNGKGRPLCS